MYGKCIFFTSKGAGISSASRPYASRDTISLKFWQPMESACCAQSY